MKSKKSAVAWLLAIGFCLFIVCSFLFVIAEADHDCIGEDCRICAQISAWENTRKNILDTDFAVAFGAAVVLVWQLCQETGFLSKCPLTLVALRVKLSN